MASQAKTDAAPPRIRVLRIIARLNVGGPAIHATLLTTRLHPSIYESTLVSGTEDAAEGNYLALHGRTLDIVSLPELGREIRGLQDLTALRKLMAIIRRTRPHIVHTHTAKAGTLGRLAAILCRVPIVVHTYHGHVLSGYFSPAKTRVFTAIERGLALGTTRLLAVTDRVRADLLAKGIGHPARFQVVPLGFDLDGLERAPARRGELRAELGIGDAPALVGIVARLVPIKAHEVFFDAAVRIAARVPEARFVVVGDGERRAELEAMVTASGLAPRVHFLGWRGDLDRIYADLDVVVLTSKNEGSPVALIEAMAAGRPVVSTAVGGVPDIVQSEGNGLLAPDGDAGAIADAVVRLLGDRALGERLGAAGKRGVLSRFAASRLIDDVHALYQELLRERGFSVTAPSDDTPAHTRTAPAR
jgi:glycosyltransferase involved in cell wall biosynthesis